MAQNVRTLYETSLGPSS